MVLIWKNSVCKDLAMNLILKTSSEKSLKYWKYWKLHLNLPFNMVDIEDIVIIRSFICFQVKFSILYPMVFQVAVRRHQEAVVIKLGSLDLSHKKYWQLISYSFTLIKSLDLLINVKFKCKQCFYLILSIVFTSSSGVWNSLLGQFEIMAWTVY